VATTQYRSSASFAIDMWVTKDNSGKLTATTEKKIITMVKKWVRMTKQI